MIEILICPFCKEEVEAEFNRLQNSSVFGNVVTLNVNYSTYTNHSCPLFAHEPDPIDLLPLPPDVAPDVATPPA